MSIYTPDIYVTLGSGNALGESTEHYRTHIKHLIIIAKPGNVETASDGTVTIDLGTKDAAIAALRYALERLEK